MNLKREQIRIITIVICSVILLSGGAQSLLSLSGLGYPSGYEGVKASFVGLNWNSEGQTGQENLVGMSFFFDPDSVNEGACNLHGEMTNAFVPEGSRPANWFDPTWWDRAVNYIDNPVELYTWDLPNPDNPDETLAYEMQEWNLKMYVSMTAEWDDPPVIGQFEYSDKRYTNTEVWIQLDVSPTWYFKGAPVTYFAIGKVVCSSFAWGKLGTDEAEYRQTSKCSVSPEASSYRYLYYQNYGSGGQVPTDLKSYQGRELNPSLFTDTVYMKLDLNNFGTEKGGYPWSEWHRGDAATWEFDVHVFVVGEWKVQDIEELPENYGITPMEDKSWFDLLLADPRFQLWSFLGLIAAVFLILAIFAPWFLFALFGLAGSFGGKK